MSSNNSEFWNSGIPFVDPESRSVDWVDVGLSGFGIVATSFFDSLASTVGAVFDALIIEPVELISSEATGLIDDLLLTQYLIDFEPALSLVQNIPIGGFVGAVGIVALGVLFLSSILDTGVS